MNIYHSKSFQSIIIFLTLPGYLFVCCFLTVRPSMPETTALGAAMAAGHCVGVWSLKPEDLTAITTDVFKPTVTSTG